MTTDEKKAAPKKAAAKKAAPRKTTRKPAAKMTTEVRAAAAAALAVFEEKLLEFDNIGLTGTAGRELKGNRSGMTKVVRFDVNDTKHRATLTVAYR